MLRKSFVAWAVALFVVGGLTFSAAAPLGGGGGMHAGGGFGGMHAGGGFGGVHAGGGFGGMHAGGGFGGVRAGGGFGGMHAGFGGMPGGGLGRVSGGGFGRTAFAGSGFASPGGFERFAATRPFAGPGTRFAFNNRTAFRKSSFVSNRFAFRHHRFFRNRFAFAFGAAFPYDYYDYGSYYDNCYERVWTRWGWRWINVCY
jgi:hypothetical protein